jgi:amidohydrolase
MTVQSDGLAPLAAGVGAVVDDQLPELIALSHQIHREPETRFKEQTAVRVLTEHLQSRGFKISRDVAALSTAFTAERTFGDGGPTIAVFCEYDALPEIGHACGHNIIAAAGAGAAVAAADYLEQRLDAGRVLVIGSPGEEGGGGKVLLADAGVLADIDAAIMVHPAGYNAVRRNNLGRLSMEATFIGHAAHASAAPERGVNALDAATLLLVALGLLRQQLRSDSRLHANVAEGGDSINVIPERSVVRLFARSTDPEYLRGRLYEAVKNCVAGSALATGCTGELREVAPAYEPVLANPVLAQLAADAFTAAGRPIDIYTSVEGSAGSTDMGNVSQLVPALHPYLQVTPGLAVHTRDFAAAAGGPDGDAAVRDGSTILATMIVALLTRPELLEQARVAFEHAKGTSA